MTRCVSALKEWTGKTCSTIIYDSTVDEFTDQGLFEKIKGKRNVAMIATTTDGDVFGGFFNVAVTEQDEFFMDPNIFIFSFESHGRCETPKKFILKAEVRRYKFVYFFNDVPSGWFVNIGGYPGYFYLGNEKSGTFCYDLSREFEGIGDNTLTGNNRENFTCTRIVAIQLS